MQARVRERRVTGTIVHNVATAPHPDDPNPEDNTDDDRDDVDDDPPPPRSTPGPDDDPLVPWLPRTGLVALSWVAIGAGLIAIGTAAHWWSRPRPT